MSHMGPGGKIRRGGLAEKVVRAARRDAMPVDEEAQSIAKRVYATAVTLKRSGIPTVMPLAVEAPLIAATELVALGIARREGIEETQQAIEDIAGYLLAAVRWEVQEFDVAKLAQWRESRANLPG